MKWHTNRLRTNDSAGFIMTERNTDQTSVRIQANWINRILKLRPLILPALNFANA